MFYACLRETISIYVFVFPDAHNPQTHIYSLALWHRHSDTMHLNLPLLFICLFGTVTLCGAQSTSPGPDASTPAPPGTSATTPAPTGTSATTPAPTGTSATTPAPTGTSATTQAPPGTSATTPSPSSSGPAPTEGTVAPESTNPPPAEGLSSGAIAGIAVGSIAGVAAVGGGIFGALKFTGRI